MTFGLSPSKGRAGRGCRVGRPRKLRASRPMSSRRCRPGSRCSRTRIWASSTISRSARTSHASRFPSWRRPRRPGPRS
ncbi:MAG TPA: hypothetical protein EYQ54_07440 [Myxococcales bacterium]|nr:hypothetical protein [Myxococcales bacterium]